jgi:hypothetical protein
MNAIVLFLTLLHWNTYSNWRWIMAARSAFSEIRRVPENIYFRFTLACQRVCIFCIFQINSPNLQSVAQTWMSLCYFWHCWTGIPFLIGGVLWQRKLNFLKSGEFQTIFFSCLPWHFSVYVYFVNFKWTRRSFNLRLKHTCHCAVFDTAELKYLCFSLRCIMTTQTVISESRRVLENVYSRYPPVC